MSYANQWGVSVAAEAPESARAEFIKKTYLHLGGAILAFIALEVLLFKSGIAQQIAAPFARNWWMIFILFMVGGWVADKFASKVESPGAQYFGLGLYVVLEALIFTPLLFIAAYYSDPSVIPTAGLITGVVFGGLTAIVFMTGKDFSFLRNILYVASLGALATIAASMIFGFSLGIVFCGAMVVLMAGYILYYTSNVLHHYPVGSHVAASLALFASIATLFWYILQILMDRD
jgi:FtsH-binding integral membrane protein